MRAHGPHVHCVTVTTFATSYICSRDAPRRPYCLEPTKGSKCVVCTGMRGNQCSSGERLRPTEDRHSARRPKRCVTAEFARAV